MGNAPLDQVCGCLYDLDGGHRSRHLGDHGRSKGDHDVEMLNVGHDNHGLGCSRSVGNLSSQDREVLLGCLAVTKSV